MAAEGCGNGVVACGEGLGGQGLGLGQMLGIGLRVTVGPGSGSGVGSTGAGGNSVLSQGQGVPEGFRPPRLRMLSNPGTLSNPGGCRAAVAR